MLQTGLVSVSFRQCTVAKIIQMAAEAQLDGIEWGGDVHVPHGDISCAAKVRQMMDDAGLKTSSYGSYYCAGRDVNPRFEPLLETAVELGAPVIRIWAGDRGSSGSGSDWYDKVAGDAARVNALAGQAGVSVAFEYHPNSLTDTPDSAMRLLDKCKGVATYWQPPDIDDIDQKTTGLERISSKLSNIHVFHWVQGRRLPLACGIEDWKKFLSIISRIAGDRYCLLEFFKDDDEKQFMEDAKVLKTLVMQYGII